MIAWNLRKDSQYPLVVYLSHDDGEGDNCILGKDFASFLENIIFIGGCGNKDWQLLPFCKNAVTYKRELSD